MYTEVYLNLHIEIDQYEIEMTFNAVYLRSL